MLLCYLADSPLLATAGQRTDGVVVMDSLGFKRGRELGRHGIVEHAQNRINLHTYSACGKWYVCMYTLPRVKCG